MKKLFTLIALLAGSMASMATDYTDKLIVTLGGESDAPADNTITVTAEDNGTYALTLKNFEMDGMSVGTINITGVEGLPSGDATILKTAQTINIEAGDAAPTYGKWLGPSLGDVPVKLTAEMNDNRLHALIDINFNDMIINVRFGDAYQIGNSDFELFHTATAGSNTSDEPNCWHSFMSCTGMLAGIVSSTPHTFISEEVRPGSAGKKSVLVKSGDVFGITANGTLTTGRLMAGGFSATDTKNNAFIDITSTDVDANGDPFYTLLNGKPDSLVVWVKFTQETPVPEHPYATVTAVITDGSFYQEPVDKNYDDIIVGKAKFNTIESNGGIWQRLSIPFDYDTYTEKDAKAILVTISTNADPGEGTTNDELFVDDLELIYNNSATGISIKGTPIEEFSKDKTEYQVVVNEGSADIKPEDIEVTTDGKGAFVTVSCVDIDYIGGGSTATITVTSNDLKDSKTYTVTTVSGEYAGISNAPATAGQAAKTMYNINGQRIDNAKPGSIFITKYADGKTVKTIKK